MRLTALSDYSLRVLMYLGIHKDRLCTISEIAKSYGISENHLMKVVNRLGQGGFIETIRGHGGGLRLGRTVDTITLGEVLRATEEDFQLVECFGEDNTCRISGPCRLKHALRSALRAYFVELDAWTVADIVTNRKALGAALDQVTG
jgi:Rrf2 family transcriptional regulator, nitric oxide-sensitive transcriptional repressor